MTRSKKRLTLILAFLATTILLVAVITNWEQLSMAFKLWPDFETIGKNRQGYKEYRHRQTLLRV